MQQEPAGKKKKKNYVILSTVKFLSIYVVSAGDSLL
jgi:hypothetical protein